MPDIKFVVDPDPMPLQPMFALHVCLHNKAPQCDLLPGATCLFAPVLEHDADALWLQYGDVDVSLWTSWESGQMGWHSNSQLNPDK